MIQKIDHIGVAVHSLEASIPFWRDVLGLEYSGCDEVEAQGVRVAFFRCGEVQIELLEPTRPDSPIATFLAKRGEGIHHVAMGTDDIVEGRGAVSARGVRLLSEAPLDGAHGKLITFLHPKDCGGVLLELTQRKHVPAHEDAAP